MSNEVKLTDAQKKMFIMFHNGRVNMNQIANQLKLSPEDANKVYVQNIGSVVTEFAGKYDIVFADDKPVDEPAKEEPVKEKELKAPVPEVEEEEPETEDDEPAEEEPDEKKEIVAIETVEADTGPSFVLSDVISNTKDMPIIIESGAHSLPLALHITGSDDDGEITTLETVPEKLPDIAIADKAVILDIEESFLYVKTKYDEKDNVISTVVKQL